MLNVEIFMTNLTKMKENCFVCFDKFDNNCRLPMMLCRNQHIACQECLSTYFKHKENPKCPQCRMTVSQNPNNFTLYRQCQSQFLNIQNMYEKELSKRKTLFQDDISDILSFDSKEQERQCLQLHSLAKQAMREGKYSLAASVLMATIQNYFLFADSEEFLGLGSINEAFCTQRQGCFEYWHLYGENLSLLDHLSICFSLEDCYERGVSWYDDMTQRFPSNFKLFFAWGILEMNHKRYENALNWLCMAEDLSRFPRICLMKAFLFLQTNQFEAFSQIAPIAIQSNKRNCFSEFIQLRLQAFYDIDKDYKQMSRFLGEYPQYINSCKWLANYHKIKKNYQKAIELLLLCSKRYPSNKFLTLEIGECLFESKEYKKALQYFDYDKCEKSDGKQQVIDSADIAEWRGICFHRLEMYSLACYWLDEKARIFQRPIKQRSVLVLLNSLHKVKRHHRVLQIVNQNSNQFMKLEDSIIRKIYHFFNISCFRLQKSQMARTLSRKNGKLVYSLLNHQTGQLAEILADFQRALQYYALAAEQEERRFVSLKKCAEMFERLGRYGEAADILEKCSRKADQAREKRQLEEKIQYLRSKQSLN